MKGSPRKGIRVRAQLHAPSSCPFQFGCAQASGLCHRLPLWMASHGKRTVIRWKVTSRALRCCRLVMSVVGRMKRLCSFFLIGILFLCSPVLALTVEELDPGQEWQLTTLTITGNQHFLTDELRAVLVTHTRPWYAPWRARPRFVKPGGTTKPRSRTISTCMKPTIWSLRVSRSTKENQ